MPIATVMNSVTDLATILRRHGVTIGQLAHACDRRLDTVTDWVNGERSAPIYIPLTVEAVARKLKPLTNAQMFAYSGDLGVPKETEYGWRFNGEFPIPARLAGALLDWRKYAPPEVDRNVKRVVDMVNKAGVYYRRTGGWVARPIMGRTPPNMKARTPATAISLGFLKSEDGRLTVTAKGRDLVYGK